MKFSELKKHLAENKPKGVYIIEGDDAFLREKSAAMLSNAAVSVFPEINLTRLENPAPNQVIEAFYALPFMAESRAVVIKEYYPKAADAETLSKLDFESSQTVLIIANTNRGELSKRVSHTPVDCSREDVPVLEKWITAMFRAGGAAIDENCARLLAQYCGRDMSRISSEAQKLLLFKEREITQDMIEQNVAKDTEYQVYMLASAICEKSGRAYDIIQEFALKGESGYIQLLLMSLYAQFKRMFYIKGSRLSQGELSEKLGIKPYAVTMTAKAAKSFTKGQLKAAMELCAEADYNIKSGRMGGENALGYVIASLLKTGA